MNQEALIARVTDALAVDERVRGLFLTGSFGRGTADEWSDVDLLAFVGKDEQEAVAADWRQVLEAITPIVYWNRLPWAFVLNAVSEDWLRCDLSIAAPGETRGMTQDRVKPLIDRDGVYPTLPEALPPPQIDRRRLEGTVNEFIRVLGLTPVGVGRGEVELVGLGTGMLRRMLTDLLVIEMNHADTGGMLHLSRLLDGERMALMETLPVPDPSIESALASQAALARAFLPRAKALYAELGMDWPARFEEAARKTLAKHIPGFDTGW